MNERSAKRHSHKKSWLETLEDRVLLSTIYVDAAAAGAANGSSWTNAFVDLQDALAAANAADEIKVAGGIYKPTADADRSVSFNLKSGITVTGGYAGAANANPDLRDLAAYPTTLSGDIGVADNPTDNSFHVVRGVSVNGVVLDGLNINGGSATDDLVGGDRVLGGGLYLSDAGVILRDSSVLNNQSIGAGGGVYAAGASTLAFINVSLQDNGTNGNGGAMRIDGAALVFISGGVFDTNLAGNDAGAMSILNGADVSIGGTTFRNNRSVGSAGAIRIDGGKLTVRNSQFLANRGATTGGAIHDAGSDGSTIINSTFVGNTAPQGAGLYVATLAGTAPSLINVTFNANNASQGGAIYNAGSVSPSLANGILWGDNGGEIVNETPQTVTATYSIVQQGVGTYAGVGNRNVNPLFIRGAGWGTDGLWGTADDDYGDLMLQLTSPAVDAGNNASVPEGTPLDLLGSTRFYDVPTVADTGVGTAPIVDMGAIETDLPVVSFAVASESVAESGQVSIVVQLSESRPYAITIPFLVSGTADAEDYTYGGASLVIPANATSGTIVLQITEDAASEADEEIIVTLGAPQSGAAVLGAPDTYTATITDDDAPVLSAIADQAVQAGQQVTFTAVASGPALTYSLDAGAPAGSSIDPQTGVFTWTPAANLAAGVYPVTVRVAKAAVPAQADTQVVNITVAAAQQPAQGSITGALFNDLSGEGLQAANEAGLAGQVLYLDQNGNGLFDAGEPQAVTDAAGTFTFTGLQAGLYSVRPIVPAGWRISGAPSLAASVVDATPVTAGTLSLTTRPLISGLVFADRNGNKKQDKGDKGLSGFRVYIDTNRNGKFDKGEPVAKTSKSGAYAFATLKLKAGKYQLRLVPNAKYTTVTPKKAIFNVTLKSGTTLLNRIFAEKPIA